MKHDYTDEEIRTAWKDSLSLHAFLAALPERPQAQPGLWPGQQEAIDAAFAACEVTPLTTFLATRFFEQQSPARLAIAQSYDAARPQAAEVAKLKEELTHAERWRDKLDTKLTEIVEAAERAGWNGVENSKNLPTFITDLAEDLSKAQAELAESQRKLAYAEEHLGILAKTFGYEGRTWCNMVSYLAPRLQRAERDLAKAEAELAALRESLESQERVYKQDSEHLESRLYKAQAELAALWQSTQSAQPILADDGTDLFRVFNQHSNTIEGLQAVAAVVEARMIRRMEAVPVGDLENAYWDGNKAVACHSALKRVCTRLISAAKGEGQAQEVPPIMQGIGSVKPNPDAEIEPFGYIQWHDGTCQPLSEAKLSTRIEITEIPDTPSGPAGTLAYAHPPQDEKQPDLSGESEEQTEPAQAQQEPVQPWTPAVGDTVRLKSGGPVMTVVDSGADDGLWPVCWFYEGIERNEVFPTACLTPAKP